MSQLLPPFIVFEGPDGLGKTTIAKYLSKQLGGIYWHLTRTASLGPGMTDYQHNALENIEDNLRMGRPVILDRGPYSEMIYATALRGSSFHDACSVYVLAQFYQLNPIVFFVMDKSLEQAWNKHEEAMDSAHPYSAEQYRAIYETHERFLQLSLYPHIRVLYSDFNTPPQARLVPIIAQINEVINQQRRTAFTQQYHPNENQDQNEKS